MAATAEAFPPYCCVMLLRGAGLAAAGSHEVAATSTSHAVVGDAAAADRACLFAELRDASAATAAGQLTCFGGKRDPGEDPFDCIRRECREEMDWVPRDLRRAVVLYVDGKLIAWFYLATGPTAEEAAGMVFESTRGRVGVWVRPDDPRMSPWHACVFEAFFAGEDQCNFVTPLPGRPQQQLQSKQQPSPPHHRPNQQQQQLLLLQQEQPRVGTSAAVGTAAAAPTVHARVQAQGGPTPDDVDADTATAASSVRESASASAAQGGEPAEPGTRSCPQQLP